MGMMRAAATLVAAFFNICRFRSAPQDLPASWELLGIAVIAYTAGSVALAWTYMEPVRAGLSGALETALMLALIHLLLVLRSAPARWLQTSTAVAGTGALFNLAGLPLFRVIAGYAPGGGMVVPYLAVLVLLGWNVAVLGHILRHALSAHFFVGLLVSIGYFWLVGAVLSAAISAGAGA